MKHFLLGISILLIEILGSPIYAQLKPKVWRFNSESSNLEIPDFSNRERLKSSLNVKIQVHGLPNKLNNSFGLETIQIGISHPYISDIKIELISPDGTLVWVSNRNGKDGRDYLETRFSQRGFKGHITQGTPPFLGEYVPDGDISNFNNGQNPNGEWDLKIYDLKKGDVGTFNGVSLFFSTTPATKGVSKCNFESPSGCRCEGRKKNGWLLPDLRIITDFTLKNFTEYSPDSQGVGKLKIGVATVNLGLGPLEVYSENKWYCDSIEVPNSMPCPDGSFSRTKLIQVIYGLKAGKWDTLKLPAGTIAYDNRPGHDHFHADEFVIYELLQKNDQINDTSSWKVISKGVKASFCIWDLANCRKDIANCLLERMYSETNIINYGLGGKYNACDEKLQGLSVGGIDYYGENYEGQEIEFPVGLKNGTYYLRLFVDPNNNYKESDESNNEIIIPIILTKQN